MLGRPDDRPAEGGGDLDDLASASPDGEPFDLIVYVNVLEHVQDDEQEIKKAAGLLAPGGRLAIAVPALQSIYGTVDMRSGHYRRYDSASLRRRVS